MLVIVLYYLVKAAKIILKKSCENYKAISRKIFLIPGHPVTSTTGPQDLTHNDHESTPRLKGTGPV